MKGFPNDLLALPKHARMDLYKLALQVVLDNQTYPIKAKDLLDKMLDEMSIPYHQRGQVGIEAWKWLRFEGGLNSTGWVIHVLNGGIFRPKGLFEEEVVPITLSTLAVNDRTCPHCQNDRCSSAEKSCWKCGGKL